MEQKGYNFGEQFWKRFQKYWFLTASFILLPVKWIKTIVGENRGWWAATLQEGQSFAETLWQLRAWSGDAWTAVLCPKAVVYWFLPDYQDTKAINLYANPDY